MTPFKWKKEEGYYLPEEDTIIWNGEKFSLKEAPQPLLHAAAIAALIRKLDKEIKLQRR